MCHESPHGILKTALRSTQLYIFGTIQHEQRPPRWCSGRASVAGAGSRGFDTRPGHTKDVCGEGFQKVTCYNIVYPRINKSQQFHNVIVVFFRKVKVFVFGTGAEDFRHHW